MRRAPVRLNPKQLSLTPPLCAYSNNAPTEPPMKYAVPCVESTRSSLSEQQKSLRLPNASEGFHIFHTAAAAPVRLPDVMRGAAAQSNQCSSLSLSESECSLTPTTDEPAELSQKEEETPSLQPLTRDQQRVLDMALDGASLFIGGDAGTGKSFLLSVIAATLAARGLRVAVTASTGIAALTIGGHTFHSAFGIPLPTPDEIVEGLRLQRQRQDALLDEDDEEGKGDDSDTDRSVDQDEGDVSDCELSGLPRPPRQQQRLKFKNTATLAAVDVIVIDEVAMLHAGFLEALERTLRRTAGRDARRPFGGVQIILSGDFMQLSPFPSSDTTLETTSATSRPGGRAAKAAQAERLICCRVQPPPHSASPATPPGSLPPVPDAVLPAAATRPVAAPPVGQRRKEVWYYDKRMFESWCFVQHLLHVQLRDPQRQKDATFAAELNALRRGELPYRISRSSLLNPPDEGAVRLLPTKAAVKNFNDCRMLELAGETRVFRTQLTMTEAMSAAQLQQRQQSRRLKGTDYPSRCRATLLIHFRLCAPLNGRRVPARARNGNLSAQELRQAELAIVRHCRLPSQSVQMRTLPVPLSYSQSLSTLCVECTARSEAGATSRRAVVKAALDALVSYQSGHVHCSTERTATPARRRTAPPSLFPREVVRLECIEWSQLLRRLQPAMQRDFRDVIRRDTVLRDKTLKIGCRVMLLRNLSATNVNGSLGTVVAYRPAEEYTALLPADMKATTAPHLSLPSAAIVEQSYGLELREETAVLPIVRMDADGREVAIPWVVLPVPVVHNDWCYVLRATCLPLTPAYAFTVHKIQGVTLRHSVLFDASGMFPCDHLVYVAASRVRCFEQLRVVNLSPGMISVHVASLRFTTALPSAQEAQQRWRTWRRAPKTSAALFLPSHRTPCWTRTKTDGVHTEGS